MKIRFISAYCPWLKDSSFPATDSGNRKQSNLDLPRNTSVCISISFIYICILRQRARYKHNRSVKRFAKICHGVLRNEPFICRRRPRLPDFIKCAKLEIFHVLPCSLGVGVGWGRVYSGFKYAKNKCKYLRSFETKWYRKC